MMRATLQKARDALLTDPHNGQPLSAQQIRRGAMMLVLTLCSLAVLSLSLAIVP